MTVSSYLPPSSLKRVSLSASIARLSHSMDDYSRLRSTFLRVGSLFFQAFQNAHGYLAKLFTGGPLAFVIAHFPSLDRSSLNAIKHEAKSQCVPNLEQIISNRRVK